MIMVRFYFPACTLNWVQARTRAPMGVCQTLSPSSENGKGSATPDYVYKRCIMSSSFYSAEGEPKAEDFNKMLPFDP